MRDFTPKLFLCLKEYSREQLVRVSGMRHQHCLAEFLPLGHLGLRQCYGKG